MNRHLLNVPWMDLELWNNVVQEVPGLGGDTSLTASMSCLCEEEIPMVTPGYLLNTVSELVSCLVMLCSMYLKW